MFKLKLYVIQPRYLAGCEALDFRRKWGLSDDSAWSPHGHRDDNSGVEVEVPEAFARANFTAHKVAAAVPLQLDWLLKEEVTPHQNGRGLILKPVSVERACDLFHRAEREKLKDQLKRLQEELLSLSADYEDES